MIDFTSRPMSNSTIVVEVTGSLTGTDRKYFFDCIRDYIKSGYRNVIVECHKLGYVNSSGLALLLGARQRVARAGGGRIYLTHLNSNVANILEITKLGRLLSVYETTDQAVAKIETQLACVG